MNWSRLRSRLRHAVASGLRVVSSQGNWGWMAASPEGFPVLGGNPPADAEVAGVADHRLGAQRPVLLEILLDPTGLVVAIDLRIGISGDHLGAVDARCAASNPPVEDQRHRVRSAHVEVVADELLKERTPGRRAVE